MSQDDPNAIPPQGSTPPPADPTPPPGSTPTPEGAAPPPGSTPPPGPAPTGQPVDYQSPAGIETNPDARLWGMLCHLFALGVFVFPAFGNVIGPLIAWLVKKDQYPFVDDQGKESLNFQITVTIALLITGASICIGIGFVLFPLVAIVALVFVIIAAIRANAGERYRYPLAIRLIK